MKGVTGLASLNTLLGVWGGRVAATDYDERTGKENKWKPECWNSGSTGWSDINKPEGKHD